MLNNEIRKTEEAEAANAHERLFNSSENKNDENDNKNDDEKIVDKKLKKKELSGDDKSESSELSDRAEEEIKAEIAENQTGPNEPNDDLHGSTVEIVQPADLKPKHLGFTRTLLLAMFAAMIGTGAQFGYAIGVMNAPTEVRIFFENDLLQKMSFFLVNQKLYKRNLFKTL
jgi:hypothetical protein